MNEEIGKNFFISIDNIFRRGIAKPNSIYMFSILRSHPTDFPGDYTRLHFLLTM